MNRNNYVLRVKIFDRDHVHFEKLNSDNEKVGQFMGQFRFYDENAKQVQQLIHLVQKDNVNADNVNDLGESLFNIVFDSVARGDFVEFYRFVVSQMKGSLRIELMVDESAMPEIIAFPWEFMRVPSEAGLSTTWLSTDPNLGFSRRSSIPYHQPVGITAKSKLRIALVIASPENFACVEYLPILHALNKIAETSTISIEVLPAVTQATPKAVSYLLRQKPDILHFVGYSRLLKVEQKEVGQIALVNDINEPYWVDDDYFSNLLNKHWPKVVLLQPCVESNSLHSQAFLGVASKLVRQKIPIVVAMQHGISSSSANIFGRNFYQQLGDKKPIDEAVQAARREVLLGSVDDQNHAFAAPILFMQVRDGNLFEQQAANFSEGALSDLRSGKHCSYEKAKVLANVQLDHYFAELNVKSAAAPFVPYNEKLYTQRKEAEAYMKHFLSSDKTGLLLVGESGTGKTNVLCAVCDELTRDGNPVLFYNLGAFVQPDIITEVAMDLQTSLDNLSYCLEEISRKCGENGKYLVLIFDALNEFKAEDNLLANTALRTIDNFITHNSFPRIKVLLSCRTSTWRQLTVLDAANLTWRNYFALTPSSRFFELTQFDDSELKDAYSKYRSEFNLSNQYEELSEFTRRRCKDPFILRLLSEMYSGVTKPIPRDAPSYDIIKRYYESKVKRRDDKFFLSAIVKKMRQSGHDRVFLRDLQEDVELKHYILSDELSSRYDHLVDSGVLRETPGTPHKPTSIKFTHDRVLEFVLAQVLLEENVHDIGSVGFLSQLAQEAKGFLPLRGAIKNILVERKDFLEYSQLARAEDLTARKIVSEALVDLFRDDPKMGSNFMRRLLSVNSEMVHHAVLEAAYYLGQEAEDIFRLGAVHSSESVRETVKGYLFALWKVDPKFCSSVTKKIISEINVISPMKSITRLSFLMDYWSLLLINNCWKYDVISLISEQAHTMFIDKLHIDKINQLPMGKQIEDVLFGVGGKVISQKVFMTVTFDEYFPIERFFLDKRPVRTIYNNLIQYLKPITPLPTDIETDLVLLLEDEVPLYKLLALLIIVGHLCKEFKEHVSLVENIFDKLSGPARYWFINAFSLYIPVDLPDEYIDVIQTFTHRFVTENRETFLQPEKKGFYVPGLELTFLPLGIASLMRGRDLTYYSNLIQEAKEKDDYIFLSQCAKFLGPLGLYYPDELLKLLAENITFDTVDDSVRDAYITALATIRTMHLEKVDGFMERLEFDSVLRQTVFAKTELELVSTHLYGVGLYNNAVNMFLWHPVMMETFSLSIYRILAHVDEMSDFVTQYSRTIYDSLRKHEWQLIQLYHFDQEELRALGDRITALNEMRGGWQETAI